MDQPLHVLDLGWGRVEIISAGGGADVIAANAGHATPMLFSARITPADPALPACELVIERGRHKPELVLLQIRSRGPEGPPLDSSNTRVPVARYMDAAIEAAADMLGGDQGPLPDWRARWRKTRGQRITREELERVAEIYRRAVAERRPPLRELERRLPVAHSSAARLVMQARAAGLLGPPPRPGVAGEAG